MHISFRAALGGAVALVWMGAAQAHEYKAGSLTIGHPWVQVVRGVEGGAGYLTITNAGQRPERLLGATITGMTGQAEVHKSSQSDGIARMEEVEGGLEVKPGETVKLAPGGYHLMFKGLKSPEGKALKGTLRLEEAGTVPVEFTVQPVGGKPDHQHTH